MKLPAMATVGKRMTAEEFEPLPGEGKLYELIDGELREISPLIMWPGKARSISRYDYARMSGAARWAV
jgi:hypothetical protein